MEQVYPLSHRSEYEENSNDERHFHLQIILTLGSIWLFGCTGDEEHSAISLIIES